MVLSSKGKFEDVRYSLEIQHFFFFLLLWLHKIVKLMQQGRLKLTTLRLFAADDVKFVISHKYQRRYDFNNCQGLTLNKRNVIVCKMKKRNHHHCRLSVPISILFNKQRKFNVQKLSIFASN